MPPCPILFTGHIEAHGVQLFEAACEHDLEGIVAKRKDSRYEPDERSADWIKIKNPHYTQVRGRQELFARV